MLLTIIIFIITLGILVLSHEFGHFFAAKKFGVKVLEFGFGLPPKVLGKRIGETLYTLNLLPIGGFVRLLGEDETDAGVLSNPRSFATQKVWKRIVIVVAGVVMNLLLAAALFYIVLGSKGFKEQLPLLTPHKFVGVVQTSESTILVGRVAADSPAAKVGIKGGERIIAVNGSSIDSGNKLIEETKNNLNKQIFLTVVSENGQARELNITPRGNPPKGEGPLGVELETVRIVNLEYKSTPQKIFSGFSHSYNLASYSFDILGRVISSSFQAKNIHLVSESLSGPVGIAKIEGSILSTESPFIPYLNFVAVLSLNLAIFNVLPIPALDGGRLFFLLVEAVFRKKVRADVERWVHTFGMVLLLTLIALITLSDIKKLIF